MFRAYAIDFVVAFGLSLVLTLVVRTLARRFGLVAKPRADRWHTKPTALFGGVAMYLAFLAVFLMARPASLEGETLLVICASGMFVVGLVDDFVQLRPYAKLVLQIVLAVVVTAQGLRLHWLPVPVMDQALTVFWLVGITNALNLLDNLDGLAGGVAVIAALFLTYFCHASGLHALAGFVAAFAGAIGGFLVFNFNPASVFMGDCGSLFLGFFLGGVTLLNNSGGFRRHLIAVLLIPVLLLLIPILDTTLVTVLRAFHGRPVSQGGRDHTSHRLVALGLSERGAAVTLWGLAAAAGAIAVLVKTLSVAISIMLVPLFGLALLFFLIVLGRVRVYQPVDAAAGAPGRALLPTLADFAYKRRIFEVLNDIVLIVLAYYGAFLLRFDGQIDEPFATALIRTFPALLATQIAAFLALGLYRGVWKYVSLPDAARVGRAVLGGWLTSVAVLAVTTRLEDIPRSVLVMDAILLLLTVGGSRVAVRLLQQVLARRRALSKSRRALIYGAGDGGELLVRELLGNEDLQLVPIGFVDDDPAKHGRVIHGVKVLGPSSELGRYIAELKPEELVVSSSRIPSEVVERATKTCEEAGLRTRRMRIALDSA